MAVPKKRTGHSAQGKRRSNWKATKPELTTCPNCGAKVLTHTVCTACGTYKGKVVSKKAEGYVEESKAEEVKEEKKAKKSTKKSEEPQEVKAEEVVEEKAEESVEEAKEEKSENSEA